MKINIHSKRPQKSKKSLNILNRKLSDIKDEIRYKKKYTDEPDSADSADGTNFSNTQREKS